MNTTERSIYYTATNELILNDTPDFFKDQETYDNVTEALFGFDPCDVFKTMPIAFTAGLAIIKNKDPELYAQYEPAIRFELFSILHDFLEEMAEDQLNHRWEFDYLSTHEFIEDLQEPFKALELLDNLYVDSFIPRV